MDRKGLHKAEYDQMYINTMRPIFDKKALFTDMTEDYVNPPEPSAYGQVTIKFRTKKNNVDRVLFVCDNEKHLMLKRESDSYFDYYFHTVQLEDREISYYFEIHFETVTRYYNYRGVQKTVDRHYDFRLIPGYKTPGWAKGAVMYQIYVDRFCNGDPSNDVLTDEYRYIGENTVQVKEWGKYPAAMGVREFYGGDLQGVLDKMDYLQDLGIDVIYFNPLFVSPSNHKYDIQDYDYIDPHFGKIVSDEGELLQPGQENRFAGRYIDRVTNKANLEASNQLFIQVVEEAHRRGMKVILDGVFNHCGSFNKWMDRERIYEHAEGYEKGAYVDIDSPYHNYFSFHHQDKWPYNSSYDGWWGHDTLPKLNYEGSKDLFEYIMHIARKWVSPPYNVDGWRLDVAADLGHSPEYNHYFWRAFRENVRSANPQALILAEHYGDPQPWLSGSEWDSVMNYDAFMEPITWFLTGLEKHSDEYRHDMYCNADAFFGAMRHYMTRFHTQSLMVAMNELSNHDHSRFMTRTNHRVGRTATSGPEAANEGLNPAIMREAVVIQMTWIGAPTIYYGDEAGVCGWTDPDNRRTYPWGREDKGLIALHRELIAIHKAYQALRTGSLKFVYGAYGVIGFGRFNEEEQFVILVNNNDYEVNVQVSVWQLGVLPGRALVRMLYTNTQGFGVDMALYYPEDGILSMRLWPFSSIVLKNYPEHLS